MIDRATFRDLTDANDAIDLLRAELSAAQVALVQAERENVSMKAAWSADTKALEWVEAQFRNLRQENERLKRQDEELLDAEAAAVKRAKRYREALEQYADPKHWGISRDDLAVRVVAWIGPGATKRGLPDPMEIARAALTTPESPPVEADPEEEG